MESKNLKPNIDDGEAVILKVAKALSINLRQKVSKEPW